MFRRISVPAPPNLDHVLEYFQSAEFLTEFVAITRKFLPKHEKDILSKAGPQARIDKFIRLFSKQYFPLDNMWDYSEGYEPFVMGMPVALDGLSYDDYEDLGNYSPEMICLLALVVYPFWVGDDKDRGITERVPLMDAARRIAGDTVLRLPPGGFTPLELHQKLDKTFYEGAAVFSEWATGSTDTIQMDNCYQEGTEQPDWDMRTVKQLKKEYPKVKHIINKTAEIETWLQEDIKSHYAELVNAIIPLTPKEQLPLNMEEKEDD
jgi:hypothetical protein